MEQTVHKTIQPGARVRVEQRIIRREEEWHTTVEGEVISYEMEPTGSWYARGKKNKLWLARLWIRKSDGEVSALNLDANSKIVVLQPSKPSPAR